MFSPLGRSDCRNQESYSEKGKARLTFVSHAANFPHVTRANMYTQKCKRKKEKKRE